MTSTRQLRRGLITVLLYAVLIAISLFMLLPFLWMVSTSLKLPEDVFGYPPVFFSASSTLLNYEYLIREKNLLLIVGNTFIVAMSATLLSLFFCSLGGFAFAKYRFPGRTALFSFLLATMIIPGAVTMVPNFVIMRSIGWVDTFWPLIVPGAANAFGIFFMHKCIY